MCDYCWSVELVDDRNRTVAMLSIAANPKNPDHVLFSRVERWRELGAVGGYVRDASGKLVTYA